MSVDDLAYYLLVVGLLMIPYLWLGRRSCNWIFDADVQPTIGLQLIAPLLILPIFLMRLIKALWNIA